MNLADIMKLQRDFDDEHGWNLNSDNNKELFDMLRKDLIGLFGEIGEFSNIVKKLTLLESIDEQAMSIKYRDARGLLAEELVDALIYLMRLASHLDINIEEEYLKKLAFNRNKYRDYETK